MGKLKACAWVRKLTAVAAGKVEQQNSPFLFISYLYAVRCSLSARAASLTVGWSWIKIIRACSRAPPWGLRNYPRALLLESFLGQQKLAVKGKRGAGDSIKIKTIKIRVYCCVHVLWKTKSVLTTGGCFAPPFCGHASASAPAGSLPLLANGNVLTFVYANQGEILCQHRAPLRNTLHGRQPLLDGDKNIARVLHFNFSPLKIMFALHVRRCSRALQIFDFARRRRPGVCINLQWRRN